MIYCLALKSNQCKVMAFQSALLPGGKGTLHIGTQTSAKVDLEEQINQDDRETDKTSKEQYHIA